mmetsp:Transcript_7722/g.20883  ORF Transcript_7722/g.20883 Transcript_7722/m.20883 type:complete len:88 (-) Transcript_7722:423-686(-)
MEDGFIRCKAGGSCSGGSPGLRVSQCSCHSLTTGACGVTFSAMVLHTIVFIAVTFGSAVLQTDLIVRCMNVRGSTTIYLCITAVPKT